MKKVIFILAFLFVVPNVAISAEKVRGYWTDTNRDGIKDTYVNPYEKTSPNSSRTDNYSYPGNYNPNKGSITPPSSSPRELYPTNPNPYNSKRKSNW